MVEVVVGRGNKKRSNLLHAAWARPVPSVVLDETVILSNDARDTLGIFDIWPLGVNAKIYLASGG